VSDYRLMRRELNPTLIRAMTRRYVVGMVLYIFAFALAFLSVILSLVLVVGLALLFVFRATLASQTERTKSVPFFKLLT
jgi:hypothetical protein